MPDRTTVLFELLRPVRRTGCRWRKPVPGILPRAGKAKPGQTRSRTQKQHGGGGPASTTRMTPRVEHVASAHIPSMCRLHRQAPVPSASQPGHGPGTVAGPPNGCSNPRAILRMRALPTAVNLRKRVRPAWPRRRKYNDQRMSIPVSGTAFLHNMSREAQSRTQLGTWQERNPQ